MPIAIGNSFYLSGVDSRKQHFSLIEFLSPSGSPQEADWQAIEVELEGLEAVDDPPSGPIENRIELSNF
jgi:hypothetical protein